VSSSIVETNPTSGSATTSSVRDNFGYAKTEIEELQRMTEDRVVTTGDYDVQVADFSNNVTLAEGVRILIEIGSLSGGAGSANDTTTPTLNVDSTGAKTIVRQDGSALVAGDLKAGQYCDLVYDATATKWVWLNSVNESPNLVSPALSGTPTAPTAAEDTNTTQIATTAFVQTATPDASASVKGIAELATAAEVITGTDTGRVITPNVLLGTAIVNGALVAASTSTGGQDNQLSIGGVIIKWGKRTSNTASAQTYRFNDQSASALPFTTACEVVFTTTTQLNSSDNIAVTAKDANGFTINKDSSDSEEFFFLAIGR